MATFETSFNPFGQEVGNALMQLLMADDIQPGDDISYQLCKIIYEYHPLGKKIADTPITLAQSQPREISVPAGPEIVQKRFVEQWKNDGCDGHIFNLGSTSRRYGVASAAILLKKKGSEKLIPSSEPIPFEDLADLEISYSIFDPLNTAGSLVGDLNPNSMDFLKTSDIRVQGQNYHRTRAVVKTNEKPIYLSYTTSAFGYTGRSVYQRILFLLKSFIRTMIADDLVATKAGVIIAKMEPAGSIVSSMMQRMFAMKRNVVKEATTNNVISIGITEAIESLNLQNVNMALSESRKNILLNIAAGAGDMPAILLNEESYANGFGEGSQDAEAVSRYIEGVRDEFNHVYEWFDKITMYRAWNKEFYETIQAEYPEYRRKTYEESFYKWKNSFNPIWHSLIQEPESEKIKVVETKLKNIVLAVQTIAPFIDPAGKAKLVEWLQENFNELEDLITVPLDLDIEAIAEYAEKSQEQMDQQMQQSQEEPESASASGEPKGESGNPKKQPPANNVAPMKKKSA
jgi:hypothetical protein